MKRLFVLFAIALLAAAPTDPRLRELWREFDEGWLSGTPQAELPALDRQQVQALFPAQQVPSEVASIRVVT